MRLWSINEAKMDLDFPEFRKYSAVIETRKYYTNAFLCLMNTLSYPLQKSKY